MITATQKESPVKVPVDYRRSHSKNGSKVKFKVKRNAQEAEKLRKDLAVRLQHLRTVAREVTETYLGNLEHNIVEIADNCPKKARTLKGLIKSMERLSVKPEKGRRKDLKKIERTVDLMLRAIQSKK